MYFKENNAKLNPETLFCKIIYYNLCQQYFLVNMKILDARMTVICKPFVCMCVCHSCS